MKKQSIIDYLENNCICSPDTNDCRSVCGYRCQAQWHWWLEVNRMKIIMSLPNRFDPPKFQEDFE